MTFERPWALLALLALPLLALALRRAAAASRALRGELHEPRGSPRGRSGVERGGAYVPPVLVPARARGAASPASRVRTSDGLVPQDRATVVLVLDVSRSMEARDVKPTRLGAAKQRDPALPRPRSRTAAGRDGRVRRRAAGRVAADDRPRAGERVARQPRRLRDLRRHRDRRRAQHGRRRRPRHARARRGDRRGQRRAGSDDESRSSSRSSSSPTARSARACSSRSRARSSRRRRRCPSTPSRSGRRTAPSAGGGGGFFPFGSERIPVPPDTRHAARDRRDDRRRVHGGARRRDARRRVREARLEPRPQERGQGSHVRFLAAAAGLLLGGRRSRRRSGRPACPRLSPA